MTAKAPGPIYIGNVQMTPPSTREAPYLFGRLQEARVFAAITGHAVYAMTPDDSSAVYRIWPGGRLELYDAPPAEEKG